jgi:hypothetical protein
MWDGRQWFVRGMAPVANASDLSVSTVSCPTVSFCVALGTTADWTGDAIAEFWNGKSWHEQGVPAPRGGLGSSLEGVDCPSPGLCVAVGEHSKVVHGLVTTTSLALRWNGGRWTVTPTPNPPDNPAQDVGTTIPGSTGPSSLQPPSNSLVAVSCASAVDCTAAGNDFAMTVDTTYAEHWNGQTWTLETTADPSQNAVFSGVSCSSRTFCIADGSYQLIQADYGSEHTLAELWDGTHWTAQQMPPSLSPGDNRLAAISCTAPDACTAVGYDGYGSGASATLVERWDGKVWSIQPTPNPSPGAAPEPATTTTGQSIPLGTVPPSHVNSLSAVSCVDANVCVAAGNFIDGASVGHSLVESYGP